MNFRSAAYLIALQVILLSPLDCQKKTVNVQEEDIAVDPQTRLKHYLEQSRFPPDSRPATIPFALKEIPLIDGDASTYASISDFSSDELKDGSVNVLFKVKIAQAGRYTFKTIIGDSDERTMALCAITKDLKEGEQTLSFRIYGLIPHLAKYSGSFVLPGIIGERVPNDIELEMLASGKLSRPPQGALKTLVKVYKTKSYNVESFTTNEWNSPEKAQKIKELQEEISKSGKN